jgi:IclR helix-turn-helix domain
MRNMSKKPTSPKPTPAQKASRPTTSARKSPSAGKARATDRTPATGKSHTNDHSAANHAPSTYPPAVSITLSPTQVDEVLRTASHNRSPSIATVIADALAAPTAGDGDELAETTATLLAHMPIGDIDPRMSRSLLRGLSILTCFGANGDSRGVVEIAEELGMSPSTTHRYTFTLVELGLLERCPRTRKYRLCRPA